MAPEQGRASIRQIDIASGEGRECAAGLHTPGGMDFDSASGRLYAVVNERGELGDNRVPDYPTSIRDGGLCGWPYSYFSQHVDARVSQPQPDLVARAIAPDHALGAHTASLGLAISGGDNGIGAAFGHAAFVGQHGSWKHEPRTATG